MPAETKAGRPVVDSMDLLQLQFPVLVEEAAVVVAVERIGSQ